MCAVRAFSCLLVPIVKVAAGFLAFLLQLRVIPPKPLRSKRHGIGVYMTERQGTPSGAPAGRRFYPPTRLLLRFQVEHEQPKELFCRDCGNRNDGRGKFLGLIYGNWIFYCESRGYFPNRFPRLIWCVTRVIVCDNGHMSEIDREGHITRHSHID